MVRYLRISRCAWRVFFCIERFFSLSRAGELIVRRVLGKCCTWWTGDTVGFSPGFRLNGGFEAGKRKEEGGWVGVGRWLGGGWVVFDFSLYEEDARQRYSMGVLDFGVVCARLPNEGRGGAVSCDIIIVVVCVFH